MGHTRTVRPASDDSRPAVIAQSWSRLPAVVAVAALLALLGLSALPATSAYAGVITVTSASDADTSDGVCTLREAIVAANNLSDHNECIRVPNDVGPDEIRFNIPGAGPHTIFVGADTDLDLPVIVYSMKIDATTEPGFMPLDPPLVVLEPASSPAAPPAEWGFRIDGGEVTILGFSIVEFEVGIQIAGGQSHVIRGNYLGLRPDGTPGGNVDGIAVNSTPDIDIGGTDPAHRNVISGNVDSGLFLVGDCGCGGNPTRVRGNYIGLAPDGDTILANPVGVVILDGANIVVGGPDAATERNVISGNGTGVEVIGELTEGIQILGNRIGTEKTGLFARPNTVDGVALHPFAGFEDGPFDTFIKNNLISGNGRYGIYVALGIETTIYGNVIGLGENDLPVPNLVGIYVEDSADTDIGGTDADERNVISGNAQDGVYFTGFCGCDSEVENNFIGLNRAGGAMGNGGNGIKIEDAEGIVVGGTDPGEGNVISGNGLDGVSIVGFDSVGIAVFGNRIGTNAAGLAAIPNLRDGVSLLPGSGPPFGPVATVVGMDIAGSGNLVSGNKRHGVYVSGLLDVGFPFESLIGHNLIGTNVNGAGSIPNERSGVFVENSASLFVFENVIANNLRTGVVVTPHSAYGTLVSTNLTYNNQGLGIDVTDVADHDAFGTITPNDDTETDDVQNFPVLTSATTSPAGTIVSGSLTSSPDDSFRIELYASPAPCDPSGHGEGRSFLGSVDVGTGPDTPPNGTGTATFVATLGQVPPNHFITALAFNEDFDTSEFSACIPVVTAAVLITPSSVLVTNEGGKTATFTVALSTLPVDDVTIALNSSDTTEGTASPSSLTFTSANGTIPQLVTVTGVPDTVADGNQNYNVATAPAVAPGDPAYNNLDGPDVLARNEDATVPSISVEPAQVTEGTNALVTMTFTARLMQASTQQVRASWKVVNGTATIGTDIHVGDAAGSVVFAAGETTRPIEIRINGDALPEPTETFTLQLVDSEGAALGPASTATGTILDNDVAAGPCSPRPQVVMTSQRTGTDQLVVTVKAGSGTIKKMTFASAGEPMLNAQIETIGPHSLIQGFGVFTPPPNVTQQSFVLRRITPNAAVMVKLIVEDGCGDWPTFIGHGPNPW